MFLRSLVTGALLTLLLTGCGVTIRPQAGGGYTANPDNSLTAQKDGLVVTAGVQDLEVAPYRMVDNITSFRVVIDNRTGRELKIPLESFVLIDDQGQQFRPIRPEKIREIVKKDSNYLIPYPYVGYYYLEDREKTAQYDTFQSSRPYYTQNYPQDIFTQALPEDAILPEAKIAGLVYFIVDLYGKKSFELRLYLPEGQAGGQPDFRFPFIVEK
ncbi:MAG: lipoprotein [Geothermobacteraceae bacterium]